MSGGVDSVVLLDMLVHSARHAVGTSAPSELQGKERSLELASKEQAEGCAPPIVIAHVDHGIRGEASAADARFVEGLARQYGVPYVSTRLELGPDASEDTARQARYAFLFGEAKRLRAVVATAHHMDDMIGSVAINLQRGTGWRGLAVLGREGLARPLLGWTKTQVYAYACEHRLEWVEDATNQSPRYLRNRLRGGVLALPPATKQAIVQLRASQQLLARDIDQTAARIAARRGGSRYFYTAINAAAATELLRYEIQQASGKRPTALQAERALLAIKTGRAGRHYQIDKTIAIQLTSTTFYCRLSPQMVK